MGIRFPVTDKSGYVYRLGLYLVRAIRDFLAELSRFQAFVLGFVACLVSLTLVFLLLLGVRPMPEVPLPIEVSSVGRSATTGPLCAWEVGTITMVVRAKQPVITETILTLLNKDNRIVSAFPVQGPHIRPYAGAYYDRVSWVMPPGLLSGEYTLVVSIIDRAERYVPHTVFVPVFVPRSCQGPLTE